MAGQILAGIRVLELGQLIAGPFAAKTLADFGAQVVKIEPPGQGDPLRKWRLLHEGTSVWWEAQSRNKQSVCVDLRQEVDPLETWVAEYHPDAVVMSYSLQMLRDDEYQFE